MPPRVILHHWVSADGRVDWVRPNLGLFYGLAGSTWQEDATLVGSDTILRALAMAAGQETASEAVPEPPADPPAKHSACDPRPAKPLLAVVDSRGRVNGWESLQRWPYWRGVVALCSDSTPPAHLELLTRSKVPVIRTGRERIDLRAALAELHRRYDIRTVRIDSGGSLSGALLRAGLVDEVSLLIEPALVGGMSAGSMFRAPDLESIEDVIRLILMDVQKLADDVVWLRYQIRR